MPGTSQSADPVACDFLSGGVRCQGWFYLPDTEPPFACVVMAHGLGADPDGPLGTVAGRFAADGLAVLAFDYRCFGASEGAPRRVLSVTRALEDWHAAIAYVRGRDEIDAARVGLWGSSMSGGQVIAVAASDHGIRAVVSQVPYVDGYALAWAAGVRHNLRILPDVLRDLLHAAVGARPHMVDWLGRPGARAAVSTRYTDLYDQLSSYPSMRLGNKVAARSLLEAYRFRPILMATEIRCPLLVVATYQDRVAPPRAAIQTAHAPPYVEMAMFSGRHFDMYVGAVAERAHNTEAKFMLHHLLNAGDSPITAAVPSSTGV